MAVAGGGGGGMGYVSNGLVMHLDGIDKGGVTGQWTSLVGAAYATFNEHSTLESNAVVMDGAGVIPVTDMPDVAYDAGTIEVVCQFLAYKADQAIISGRVGEICMMRLWGDYFSCAIQGGTDAFIIFTNGGTLSANPCTVSVKKGAGYMNGVLSTATYNQAFTCNSYNIGGRGAGSYANVRIFSIRIYDRLLSEAEILANQRVDNERFNLGLTI